ncbi:efflux RND transporter periplasmic adaptor subunit [Nitrospina gracilis]|uniref:efflux RND transporter periplasmic adaptor subunit n=1 Tax=Nitrospina gracilis TaxID=35801 RepID=UPI001F02945B|nr:efflux RND transporter periplasmic adaptor subunit [Nitrospina gracilis]MCF8719893.1 membrane fusion protein (multidrug efflux system) [Nitrospina gracilis Nb-211]
MESPTQLLRTLFMLVAVLLAGCQQPNTSAGPQAKQPPPMVTVTPVVHQKIVRTHELVGRTASVRTVNLVTRVEGFLEKRNFKEGEDVSKGDLLFIVEQEPYQIAVRVAEALVAEAEATLENARTYLKRVESVRKGAVSQSDLDKAESDFKRAEAALMQAKANLEQAQLNLSYTEIRAPFSGRISRVNVHEGNLVKPDTGTLATLVQMDPMYALFTVDSGAVLTEFQNQIKRGKATTFTPKLILPNGTEYPYAGIEDFVDHRVDERTGTITIRAKFPNPAKNVLPGKAEIPHTLRILLPGQFVRVRVQRDEVRTEKVIPQAAIQQDQTGKFVLVVDAENRVHKRNITTGEKEGIKWVVKEGLEVGEMVIVEGLQKVRPGVTVQIASKPSSNDKEGA